MGTTQSLLALTADEQSMLDGDRGPAVAMAMRLVTGVASGWVPPLAAAAACQAEARAAATLTSSSSRPSR